MTINVIDALFDLLRRFGTTPYVNNSVRDFDHALQTAALARADAAPDALVAAALFHDIGRLVIRAAIDGAAIGYEDRHEEVAGTFLSVFFAPDVTEPIRLHVAAKRYLFTVDDEYRRNLSKAAQQSLVTQGGTFDAAAVRRFEQMPFAFDAIRLRRWDDQAMKEGEHPAPLESFRQSVANCLLAPLQGA